MAALCVLPFLHVLALSFSAGPEADAGRVGLWPIGFTLSSYSYAFQKQEFIITFWNTVKRLIVGLAVQMTVITLTAYPLSKSNERLPGRTVFAWFFVVTMLVGGGLIPTYLVVMATGLRNTIWALILPIATNAFHVTILLNFFRQIPADLEDSAFMDGAGPWRTLIHIYLPLSKAALATLVIFNAVFHWNEWFMGLIYMDNVNTYPLQTYLRSVIVEPDFVLMDTDQLELLMAISRRTFNAAQIIMATIPIILVYPFLQRHFVKGMTLGSLKG
jgi:putative aldouronate transport system permease protein